MDLATRALLYLSLFHVAVAGCTIVGPGCATAPGSRMHSDLAATALEPSRPGTAPGVLNDDDTLPPSLIALRSDLEARLVSAHRRLGRGRPATTAALLGELGPGGAQAFAASLSQGLCYTIIVVGATDDQEIDLLLFTDTGEEVARDLSVGSAASIEVCPPVDGVYRTEVRMYGGSGPFALQVYGS